MRWRRRATSTTDDGPRSRTTATLRSIPWDGAVVPLRCTAITSINNNNNNDNNNTLLLLLFRLDGRRSPRLYFWFLYMLRTYTIHLTIVMVRDLRVIESDMAKHDYKVYYNNTVFKYNYLTTNQWIQLI